MTARNLFRSAPFVSGLIILLLLLNLGLMAWLGLRWLDQYRERFLEQAEQALIEGSKGEAIRALAAHLRHYPDDEAAASRLEQLRQEYRRRYLDKVEADLKVGDKVAAIRDYLQHIQQYPEDYAVRLKLGRLYEELGINDSAEALYRELIADLEGSGSRYEALARERLLRHVNEWANGIKRQADRLFQEDDFEAAAGEYARVINLRSRNPALSEPDSRRSRALSALNNVIAKRAFSLWRANPAGDVMAKLASPHDADVFAGRTRDGRPDAETVRQRQVMLSNFFWDYADRLFERGQWRQAADVYARTLGIRSAANNGDGDPNTPTLLFNYALSSWRAGDTAAALQALRRIQSEFPYHEKAAVRQLLEEVEKAVRGEQ